MSDDHRSVPLSGLFNGNHTPEFSASYYDKRAQTYDHELVTVERYEGPQVVADMVNQYVKDKDAKILCIAAGTGLEGVKLHAHGFHRIHAQDGSAKMIELAQKRGIFEECRVELLYHDRESAFEANSYDVMTALGCIMPGNLDERYLDDLLRVVKVGGLTFTATHKCFTRPVPENNWPYDLQAKIEQMQKDGLIELIERREVENYGGLQPHEKPVGVIYVYRKK